VIQLTKRGLGDDNIAGWVRTAGFVDFDLSPSGRQGLREGGVSQTVLAAMEARVAKQAAEHQPQSAGHGEPSALASPPVPAAPAPGVPLTITLGESIDEVTKAFGTPPKTLNLGDKRTLIFYYQDMKVTFRNGRVVHVE